MQGRAGPHRWAAAPAHFRRADLPAAAGRDPVRDGQVARTAGPLRHDETTGTGWTGADACRGLGRPGPGLATVPGVRADPQGDRASRQTWTGQMGDWARVLELQTRARGDYLASLTDFVSNT